MGEIPGGSFDIGDFSTERHGHRIFIRADNFPMPGSFRMDIAIRLRDELDMHIRDFNAENGARVAPLCRVCDKFSIPVERE